MHYVQAAGRTVAIYQSKSNGTEALRYLHGDHLSSVTEVMNSAGSIEERLSYDAFGQRRQPSWQDAGGPLTPVTTPRGYTGHEHLDTTSLIHMNGRVYDPDLGRFTSADPFVQAPFIYATNKPLNHRQAPHSL